MNILLNKYSGFCFELNFELNHCLARFNEKMNFQNVSNIPRGGQWGGRCVTFPYRKLYFLDDKLEFFGIK